LDNKARFYIIKLDSNYDYTVYLETLFHILFVKNIQDLLFGLIRIYRVKMEENTRRL